MTPDPLRTLVHAGVRVVVRAGGPADTAEDARRTIAERQRRPQSWTPPSGRSFRRVEVSIDEAAGYPVYRLDPAAGPAAAAGAVVYFHGGAYIGEIASFQWNFIADLVRRTGVPAYVPIYPLAPRQTAAATVPQAVSLVSDVIAEHERVTVLGDSAGGGLALATVLALAGTTGPGPRGLVLVAPWLDVTMEHPDQAAIEPRDLMLTRAFLAEAGRAYAGDLDVRDPRVSPLFGDPAALAALPPTTVLVGTDDVLLPDSRRFAESATAAGVPVDLVEEPGMQHVYPVFPLLRQARSARERISRAVTAACSVTSGP